MLGVMAYSHDPPTSKISAALLTVNNSEIPPATVESFIPVSEQFTGHEMKEAMMVSLTVLMVWNQLSSANPQTFSYWKSIHQALGKGAFKAFPRVGRSGDMTWDYENDALKSKRQAGLFPFPRVGRSGDLTWEFAPEGKRQGLIPFPRVGRSGPAPAAAAAATTSGAAMAGGAGAGAAGAGRFRLGPAPLPAAAALLLLDAAAAAPELARRAGGGGGGAGGNGGGGDMSGGGDNDGMWFGPRLGRRSRRSLALEGPWTIVPLREA